MVIPAQHVGRGLLAVSDDLTGAAACAADIARAGRTVSVRPWTARPDQERSVVILDSASRMERASVGAARVTDLIERWHVPGERAYYHRVDSALRGHIAAELDAVCRALGRPVAVAPAAPAFGVVTRDAIQRLGDRELPISRHVPRPIVEIGIAEVRGDTLTSVLDAAVRRGCCVVCDAESEGDLARLAASLRTVDATPVGSYGLGCAWARESDSPVGVQRCVLAAVGSPAPATLAQVAAARAAGIHVEILGSDHAAARSALRLGYDVVLATADPCTAAVSSDAAITGKLVAAVFALLHESAPSGLVLVGGQLASEFVRAAGVERLDVICEPWPTVPVMRLRGGQLDGLVVAVKSGAREAPGWLISSLRVVGSVSREVVS